MDVDQKVMISVIIENNLIIVISILQSGYTNSPIINF